MKRIVYLHGFASSPSSTKARYFRRLLEEAGATVETPDLAAGDFERLTISGQLRVVERAAGSGPVSLMGSSMGGYLAALYAARHPEVERLVLLAPAFRFARRWEEHLATEAIEQWRQTGTMKFFHFGEGREMPLHYGLLEDAAAYEDYPDFRQPALIYHGANDDVVPAAFSREFAGKRANARLRVMDSGHDLLNVMEEIAPEVTAFLAGGAIG